MTNTAVSPFHRGEREIQSRLGVREQIENVGQRFIRDHLPGEHRQFYAQLPMLLVGSVDNSGRPWASVLVGRPGFLISPDPRTLEIHSRPFFGEGLRPAYSCRSGICQTCSTGIMAGGVDYLESPMAAPGPGDALLCCSYPTLSPGEEEVVLDI